MYFWLIIGLFFLSVMETISHHFYTSVFARIKNEFWFDFFKSDWRKKYKDPASLELKKGFDYIIALIDGYHVSKWLMLFCFAEAMGQWWYFIPMAFLEYIVHNVFYGKIWVKK